MRTLQLKLSDLKLTNFSHTINFLLLFVALFAVSFTAIFIKISVSEISSNATLFNRLWIVTIIFGIWNGFKKIQSQNSESATDLTSPAPNFQPWEFFKQGGFLLVIVATLHLSGRFIWTWSLTQTTAANATVLSNMTPVFTTLGSWLFLGHYFDRRFLTGLSLAMLGTITLGARDVSFSGGEFIGDIAAVCSAIFYSIGGLISQKVRQHFDSATILMWRSSLSTVFMLPVVLIFDKQILPISPLGWVAVIGLAALSEATGHGLAIYSMKHFTVSFLSVFFLLESVVTALLAWIIFAEKVGVLNCFAFLTIIVGIYFAKTGKGAETKQ